jgi:hypothetical protein
MNVVLNHTVICAYLFTKLPSSASFLLSTSHKKFHGHGGCAGKGELDRRRGAGHAVQGTRARGQGPHLGELARAGPRPKPWSAAPSSCAAAAGGRARVRGRALRRRGRGAGDRGATQTLEIEENEEQEWRSSPAKKTLAGAEAKYVDCRRFGDPNKEPNMLRRSPRRDERSGTLGFGRRCTDWE